MTGDGHELDALVDRAKEVLEHNWVGHSTKPAPALYPHQWSWDSGFIAIGTAHFDQAKARCELESLFAAQWANGMIPQIVFNPDTLGHYFPEPDFWQCERSPNAPGGALTSGITMPPVHAIAVRRIVDLAPDRGEALEWARGVFPNLVASHEYLYRERDPDGEGLAAIRHPWESGMDNSPAWDGPLKAIRIDRSALPAYTRRDLDKGVPAEQRPTDEDYDRYVFLVDLFRRHGYDEAAIRAECPFQIQDPLFNSILCRADQDLVALGRLLDEDTTRFETWERRTRSALRAKLYHETHGAYDAFDLVAGKRTESFAASGFMPLLCGAPSEDEGRRMVELLHSRRFSCGDGGHSCYSIPNYAFDTRDFNRSSYWRGPVWINTNWMLMHGLRRYGFDDTADKVAHDIVALVDRAGFWEYFDPFDGAGYGTDSFSWTAALFLDTVLGAPAEP